MFNLYQPSIGQSHIGFTSVICPTKTDIVYPSGPISKLRKPFGEAEPLSAHCIPHHFRVWKQGYSVVQSFDISDYIQQVHVPLFWTWTYSFANPFFGSNAQLTYIQCRILQKFNESSQGIIQQASPWPHQVVSSPINTGQPRTAHFRLIPILALGLTGFRVCS